MSDTVIFYEKNGAVVSAGFTGGKIDKVNIEETDNAYGVGNIYVGRVSRIILHLNAAYVDIGMSSLCFMQLKEGFKFAADKIHPDGKLHVGDCIPVQIVKEAFRKKPVTVSPELAFTNRLFVVKYNGNTGISFSSKIKDGAFKKSKKEVFSSMLTEGVNILFRTNSCTASDEDLMEELTYDLSELNRIMKTAAERKAKSLIYSTVPQYIVNLRDNAQLDCNKIVTDSPDVFIRLKDYLERFQPQVLPALSFYSDTVLSLDALYDMKKHLSSIVAERVWLKSGAHLVIEQTEALVSIDVNSAKASSSVKNFKEGFMQINLEAAEEIFRQLEVRELSGIIVADFISMQGEEEMCFYRKLVEMSRRYKGVTVVDITKLGLVEITRDRRLRPIRELILKYKLLD